MPVNTTGIHHLCPSGLYCVRSVGVVCMSTRRLVRCRRTTCDALAKPVVPQPREPGALAALPRPPWPNALEQQQRSVGMDTGTNVPGRSSLPNFLHRVGMGAGWYSPPPPPGLLLIVKMEMKKRGGCPPAAHAMKKQNERIPGRRGDE